MALNEPVRSRMDRIARQAFSASHVYAWQEPTLCHTDMSIVVRASTRKASPGGDVNVALSIVDLMNLWKKVEGKKVKSFCLGECSSAGLTILSSCDNEFRECAPNTRFLFHSHFYRVNLRHNLGLEANQQALLKQWQWFEKAIKQESDGFKLSDEKIMELRQFGENHSYSLNPNEAKELGIIAKITDMPSIL